MTRQEWTDLARLVNRRREEIVRRFSDGYKPHPYERQLMRAAQLAALDETTRLLAQWLESRSSRFSKERFLLLAGVKPD